LINPSGRTVVLGSIRLLTKMITGVIYWGLKAADAQG